MTTPVQSRADANRQTNAVNLVARHLADRPAHHITRRVMGEAVVWRVESQTEAGKVYTVTLTADGWPADTCDCEDCCYRHMECKHIRAAQALARPAQVAQALRWTSEERKSRKRTEPTEEV